MLLKQNDDAGIKIRLSSNYIPSEIERMQQLFIESPVICLWAILHLKSFYSNLTPEVDNVAFIFSTKKKQEYYKVCWLLYNKCNVKSLRKHYCGSTVRRVRVAKPGSSEFLPLGIPTLRDRVLQTIVHMALTPIAEWQADPFSSGFGPKRSAVQLVSCIANQLGASGPVQPYGELLKKVGYESYKKYKGPRYRVRSHLITKGGHKRRRKYSYKYWISIKEMRNKKSCDTFYLYPCFINVDIDKCLDRISHSSILEYTAIAKKHRFLLKAWLYASIYCPKAF